MRLIKISVVFPFFDFLIDPLFFCRQIAGNFFAVAGHVCRDFP